MKYYYFIFLIVAISNYLGVSAYTIKDKCHNQPLFNKENYLVLRYKGQDCIFSEFEVSSKRDLNGILYCGTFFRKGSNKKPKDDSTIQFDDIIVGLKNIYDISLLLEKDEFNLNDGSLQENLYHIKCPSAKTASDLENNKNICIRYKDDLYILLPLIIPLKYSNRLENRCISKEHIAKIDKFLDSKRCQNQPLFNKKDNFFLKFLGQDCIFSEFGIYNERYLEGIVYCGNVFEKDSNIKSNDNSTIQFDDKAVEIKYIYTLGLNLDYGEFNINDGSLQKNLEHTSCPNAKNALPEEEFGYILDLKNGSKFCIKYMGTFHFMNPIGYYAQSIDSVMGWCISDERLAKINYYFDNRKCINQPLFNKKNNLFLRYNDQNCIFSEFDVSSETILNGVLYCGKIFEKDEDVKSNDDLTIQFDDKAVEIKNVYSVKLVMDEYKLITSDDSLQNALTHQKCPGAKSALPEEEFGYVLDLKEDSKFCAGYIASFIRLTPKIASVKSIDDVKERCISEENITKIKNLLN